MITLQGKGVYGGIAIGTLLVLQRRDARVSRQTVKDIEGEIRRFEQAKERCLQDLQGLYEQALRDIGKSGAAIFEIHRMMLEDEDYNHSVCNTIRTERVCGEYAVFTTAESFSTVFSAMSDPYMQARAVDIREISQRLIDALNGKDTTHLPAATCSDQILCADDLAPGQTMQLDRARVSAFVTADGSVNSHTAILARTMEIPAVVGIGSQLLEHASNGIPVIVDGFTGTVYLEPDAPTAKRMEQARAEDLRAKALLQKYKGMDNVTKDGKRIDLFANIQGIREVGAALLGDAGGIGLFRSEFLYLDRNTYPDEEEQFSVYKTVLQSMGGKKVVIRTLDIGADKQADYFGLDKEENPALGLRAIRICLCRPEILRTQLRALLRASVFGTLAIMFPMITSEEEVIQLTELTEEVKKELDKKRLPYASTVELGIMIETPAAALISHRLAPLVDFFSIGTNDLTQYTLAMDRQNPALFHFFNPHHPALLSLIEQTVQNAHDAGKWVGLCGELAADMSLTEWFLKLGLDELSVSPGYILPLRDRIRNLDLSEKTSEGAQP